MSAENESSNPPLKYFYLGVVGVAEASKRLGDKHWLDRELVEFRVIHRIEGKPLATNVCDCINSDRWLKFSDDLGIRFELRKSWELAPADRQSFDCQLQRIQAIIDDANEDDPDDPFNTWDVELALKARKESVAGNADLKRRGIIPELSTRKSELTKGKITDPEAIGDDEKLVWIGPISKAEMARRITQDADARWRKVESMFPAGHIKQSGGQFLFRIDQLELSTQNQANSRFSGKPF